MAGGDASVGIERLFKFGPYGPLSAPAVLLVLGQYTGQLDSMIVETSEDEGFTVVLRECWTPPELPFQEFLGLVCLVRSCTWLSRRRA